MRRLGTFLPVTLLLVLFSGSTFGQSPQSKVAPFFKQHCIQCHGPDREEGGLRVDEIEWDIKDLSSIDELQHVLDEIVVDSMPPASEPRPKDDELEKVTKALSQYITEAKSIYRSGGGKPIRRLTKTEYVNTVFDLLGVHINPDEMPDDGLPGSFDTEALDLYTTDAHLLTSLDAARDAAKRFIASRNMKPGETRLKSSRFKVSKKNRFKILPNGVPPAGHQIARLVVQKKGKSSESVFFGPIENATYEVTGISRKPQQIDRVFITASAEVWRANPNVDVVEIQNIQVVSRHPYEFFEKFRKRDGIETTDRNASQILLEFATLMSRGRKVDKKFVSDLQSIFKNSRKQGLPFWEAMVEPMAVAMCSIESMFHFETRGEATDSKYVSPIEMVNRVSYFLWRSAPDAELIRLANSKQWYDSKIRGEQYKRMMEDDRFDRFLNDFTNQWLELDRQDSIAVNDRIFVGFNHNAKASIKQETIAFVSHVVRENLPLSNLIDSDFMMVNNLMAQHYRLKPVSGDEFRRIDVPKGSRRGGLLTQAGILMQTGTGDRTSIVERGAFVLRKFLNDPPGDPPPLVDELPTEGDAVANLTAAELVEKHRSARQCASCHQKIDAIGVGMEELDGVGQFRTVDLRPNPNVDKLNKRQRKNPNNHFVKVQLETKGKAAGKSFSTIEGLKKALMNKEGDLAEAFVQALLTMSNGRQAGVADQAIVKNILERAKKVDYPAQSILIAVLQSDAFTTHSTR